ncbi:MAG: malto-oligosyltrehalose trehalohydrolase [Thermoplasmata archaeon]|jgi:maltooligosyltrehalose trehalohydrolase
MVPFDPVGPIRVGADRFRLVVWAPRAESVTLVVTPGPEELPLERGAHGYFTGEISGVTSATRYGFRLDDGRVRPDPASRAQPEGVHGLSAFDRSDAPGDSDEGGIRSLAHYVYYEMHVGTATPEGTLEAAAHRLPELAELGVTAVELMPVNQFPGRRNWGYDGVFPWAVHTTYGGPEGLRRFVAAAHALDLAVVLDVVMNHLGPEGNVLPDFAPYFLDGVRTPWGPAVNLDGAGSEEVRRYWGALAFHWIDGFGIDALRLDAVHALVDRSARPFLGELARAVADRNRTARRPAWLIAESDLNDARLLRPARWGGLGLMAQWADDFHHALHAVLTGERAGYYADFGPLADLAIALERPYVYDGRYSIHRGRRHGNSPEGLPAWRFVAALQNHDQIGNRLGGERLAALLPYELLKVAVALHLLAPWRPLLFQGEEWASRASFTYFTDHSDPTVIAGLREGRRREFEAFGWTDAIPDPQDPRGFEASRWDAPGALPPGAAAHRSLVRELLRLRRTVPALDSDGSTRALAWAEDDRLEVLREHRGDRWGFVVRLSGRSRAPAVRFDSDRWRVRLDTAEPRWNGPGPALTPGEGAPDRATCAPQFLLLHEED